MVGNKEMKNRPARSTFQLRLSNFVESIKEDRARGILKPGEYLPSEIELAKIYKLSKMSIRKGLDQLVMDGVIEKIPRVGNRILEMKASEKKLLRFACHSSLIQETVIEDLIKSFEEKNPDIEVEIFPIPFQQYIESIDYYVDNDLIDCLAINFDQYTTFMNSGRLKLLEPQEKDSDVYDIIQNVFVYNNTLYARPFVFSPVILCYNPKHFMDKGLPEPDGTWTWEDLMQIAKRLSDGKDRYGFYFHLLSQNRWPIFLMQNGCKYNAKSHTFNSSLFIESMKLCRELILEQGNSTLLIADSDLFAEQLFVKEKASVIMTTYFNLNYIMNSGIPFEIAPLPYIKKPKSLLLTIGISVMKTSSRKDAAQRFADYLTSYDSQLYIRQNTLSIPCIKQAAERNDFHRYYQPKTFKCYEEMLPTLCYYDELGMTSLQLLKLRDELSLYWSGLSEETHLLDELQKILDSKST